MKKLLFTLMLCMVAVWSAKAQQADVFVQDFEQGLSPWGSCCENHIQPAAVDVDPTNANNHALKLVGVGDDQSWATIPFWGLPSFNSNNHRYVAMRIKKSDPRFRLKLQLERDGDTPSSEVAAAGHQIVGDNWEVIFFDFKGLVGDYPKCKFVFDCGDCAPNNVDGKTIYIDDIYYTNTAPTILISKFATNNANTPFSDFAWEAPHGAPDRISISIDNAEKYSGDYSLKLSASGGDTWAKVYFWDVPLWRSASNFEAGKHRFVIFKSRKSNDTRMLMQLTGGSGTGDWGTPTENAPIARTNRTNMWETMVYDFKNGGNLEVGKTYARPAFILQGEDLANANIWIDDYFYSNATAFQENPGDGVSLEHTAALLAKDAGSNLRYDNWSVVDWGAKDTVYWPIDLKESAMFDVKGYQGNDNQVSNFMVSQEGRSLPVSITTPDWNVDTERSYGKILLSRGVHNLSLIPTVGSWSSLQVRKLELTPTAPIAQSGSNDIALAPTAAAVEVGVTVNSGALTFTQNGRVSWLYTVATVDNYKVAALMNGNATATFAVKVDGVAAFTKTVTLANSRDTSVTLGVLSSHAVGKHIVEITRTDANVGVILKGLTLSSKATLNVAVVGDGSVAKTPDQTTYNVGESVKLVATPAANREFAGWSGDVAPADVAKDTINVTMNADIKLTATFQNLSSGYQLTINATNGSVTKAPQQARYTAGTSVTLTPVPNTHYEFSSWSDGGAGNPRTFVMPAQDTTFAANFAKTQYTFALSVTGSNGTVDYISTKGEKKDKYIFGDTVVITATPATGYKLTNWTGSCTSSKTKDTIAIVGNTSIAAEFAKIPYTIALNVKPEARCGTAVQNPNTTHGIGDVVSLAATANSYFKFVSWTDSINSTNANETFTYTATNLSNKTMTANFAQEAITPVNDTLTLPAAAVLKGAGVNTDVDVNTSIGNWKEGSMLWKVRLTEPTIFRAVARMASDWAGASIGLKLKVNGDSVSAICATTGSWGPCVDREIGIISIPAGEYTLSLSVMNPAINFDYLQLIPIPTYTLSVACNSTEGSVSKSPDKAEYLEGDTVIVTATPLSGYTFVSWSGDLTSNKATDTIVMTANKVITATFVAQPTMVSRQLIGKFSIHPNPFSEVLTIRAQESGYTIVSVEVIDVQGRLCIPAIAVNEAEVTLSGELSILPQGTYYIRVNTNKGSVSYQAKKK